MAEANEEKNAKMKEALGIKKDYKDGSSFDQELKAAQRAATQLAWEAKQKELEKQKEKEEIKRWGFTWNLFDLTTVYMYLVVMYTVWLRIGNSFVKSYLTKNYM